MSTPDEEIARLKNEVHAKDETLNQLKVKTKAFVDNMRNELATEKKRVIDLEEQLKHAKEHASVAPVPDGNAVVEIDNLKKELAAVTQRENDLKARTRSFADNMKSQLAVEKEKAAKLEQELQKEKKTSLSGALDTSHLVNDAKKDQEIAQLQAQVEQMQQQVTTLNNRLRASDQQATERSQETKSQYEDRLRQLQNDISQLQTREQELQSALMSQQNAQGTAQAALAAEHGRLEDLERQNNDFRHQTEQMRLVNDQLQQQMVDKDVYLQQVETLRVQAADHQATSVQLATQVTMLQQQLRQQQQVTEQSCHKCESLQIELLDMTSLYDSAIRSSNQSDAQLQSLQHEKDELVLQKETEMTRWKESVAQSEQETQRLSARVLVLQEKLDLSTSDSLMRQQQVEKACVMKEKDVQELRLAQEKAIEMEKKARELAATLDATVKDNNDKKQKVKALVLALTSDKQTLLEKEIDHQKEIDRLRMELNQRNVEIERRLKHVQEENNHKLAQSTGNAQKLHDEISTLRQTLTILQESEKNQQRTKELAKAKQEVEDSNKKRLAAKAETQKLAMDLESVQKCLTHLSDHTNTQCGSNVRRMNLLQDRVAEALQVLEKRAVAHKKLHPSSTNKRADAEVDEPRGPESTDGDIGGVASPRERVVSSSSSVKRVEENIARMNDKLSVLVESTEKLCDVAIEQNDVVLKDVLIDRMSSLFTQCFSEKLRAAYTQVDDTENQDSVPLKG